MAEHGHEDEIEHDGRQRRTLPSLNPVPAGLGGVTR